MTVTVANVATELARSTPTSPTSDQWESWIDRAYRLIEGRLGATAYAALDTDLLDDVVLMAVSEHVRAWRDSTAKRSTTTIDDGTVSREFDSPVGLLEIPDRLWDLIDPEPVAGGLLVALALLVLKKSMGWELDFDMSLKDPLMLAFFATIGLNANIASLRAGGEPTVPFPLSRELATNPFLRADDPAMMAKWGGNAPHETFAALRAAKDNF